LQQPIVFDNLFLWKFDFARLNKQLSNIKNEDDPVAQKYSLKVVETGYNVKYNSVFENTFQIVCET
jgi:hypothetical protein